MWHPALLLECIILVLLIVPGGDCTMLHTGFRPAACAGGPGWLVVVSLRDIGSDRLWLV